MRAPQFPSFFKTQKTKEFSYHSRYWNKQKENLKKGKISEIMFNQNKRNHQIEKGRNKRIIFLIIVLSLLVYYLLT